MKAAVEPQGEDEWFSDCVSETPQRYAENFEHYSKRKGALNLKSILMGFTHKAAENKRDMTRFFAFCLIYDQIKKEGVVGDIAELGVYRGNTACLIAHFARQLGVNAYLFDTFRGFDENDLRGIDNKNHLSEVDASIDAQFAHTSLESVRNFIGGDNVIYVKGHFPNSTEQIPSNLKFSFVHIDCDLYVPILSALQYFYPRMVEGGVFILHDYLSMHWDGAETAIDQFFADKAESIIPLPDSAGTAIVRKCRRPDKYNNWYMAKLYDWLVKSWVGGGRLHFFLDCGWDNVENWGVWGLGEWHYLRVVLPFPLNGPVTFVFDVEAQLIGSRTYQSVEVWVDNARLTTWEFTLEKNRCEQKIVVPEELARKSLATSDGISLTIGFRSSQQDSPNSLDPTNPETCPKGLGVYKFKIKK